MFPIRDTIRSTTFPIINTAIIAVNAAVFLFELANISHLQEITFLYGLVPARYSIPAISDQFSPFQQLFPLLSFMFLHGSFWHFLGNMWFLYIFGDNVEDKLGPLRYLLFYLLCGWASGFAHLLTNLGSDIPTIGASGAIAGVMGAYFLLYPRSRIITLVPILFIPYFMELPSFLFLGIWIFMQLFSAALIDVQASGIAWWAHIGGFIFGMIGIKIFLSFPESAMSRHMREFALRKQTPALRIMRADDSEELDISSSIQISPKEALHGTRKLIKLQNGPHKRLFWLTIPAGARDGSFLRLAGLGKARNGGETGDLYLKISILR